MSCALNRRGTLLACGLSDGRCVIWDFDTRVVSKVLALPSFEPPSDTNLARTANHVCALRYCV